MAITFTTRRVNVHTRPRIHDDAASKPRPRHATPSLWIGGAILALWILAATLAPIIAPYAPDKVLAGAKLSAPSAAHLFGTDALGRDVFTRVLFGAQIAVGIATIGVAISAFIGIALGLVAGYRGGWTDQIISRALDVWLAFPGLLLALVIVARLGPSLENCVLALGIVGVPGFYRVTRGATMCARRMLYVQAAEAVGVPERRILVRHILPNLASPLIVMATLRASVLVLSAGALSFVGLGAQLPTPEWGTLLASGRDYLETAPWLAIFPGASITLAAAGLNLFGDGLRDWLDPRLRINANHR
ncbi:MAG: ABC transporter permease [Chloroflexi bacterium]|nr:ABC transporter permease [Chloroflexota bacterium]